MNKNLIVALQDELVKEKIQHIQLLIGSHNGQYIVKFTSVDNDNLRERLRAITDRYCESLMLIKETKTTRVFAI